MHNLSPALCTQISEKYRYFGNARTLSRYDESACCELFGNVYGRIVFDELKKVRDFLPAPNVISLITLLCLSTLVNMHWLELRIRSVSKNIISYIEQ